MPGVRRGRVFELRVLIVAAKPVKEKAAFVIRMQEGGSIRFACDGSVVAGIVEAFTLLAPERRTKLLERLQAKQQELVTREAKPSEQ